MPCRHFHRMMETHDINALVELAKHCGEGLDSHVQEFAREMTSYSESNKSAAGSTEEEDDEDGSNDEVDGADDAVEDDENVGNDEKSDENS